MSELENKIIHKTEAESMQIDKLIKIIYETLDEVEEDLKLQMYPQAYSMMTYYCELMNGAEGRIYLYRNGHFNNIKQKYTTLSEELKGVTLDLFERKDYNNIYNEYK